jgi:DNA-binding NtrC family response regulator
MARVLIIEKKGEIRKLIERRFSNRVSVEAVTEIELSPQKSSDSKYDLVICNADGCLSERLKVVHALQKLCKQLPNSKLLIVSDSEEPHIANTGAKSYQWIQRPIPDVELAALIGAVLEINPDTDNTDLPSPDLLIHTEFEGILAISLPMRSVIQHVIEAASMDAPVLITGESGTGKDLVAAAIHKRSKRKTHPYVPVNMGAIPHELIASELFGHEKGAYTGASEAHKGVFEQAHGGTIFLDEITTMDEKLQVSLLRALETKTIRRVGGNKDVDIDTRIIAATNDNIEETVKARRLREDLYYRLDVFRIHLPPLRERPGDVSFLTNHFISLFDAMYNKAIRLASREIYQLLRSYPWPGNVRELKNVIQRAVVMATGAELTPDLLPARIHEASGSTPENYTPATPIHIGMSLAEAEKVLITMTLSSVGGNKAKAASILAVSRHALYDKLKRHGLL